MPTLSRGPNVAYTSHKFVSCIKSNEQIEELAEEFIHLLIRKLPNHQKLVIKEFIHLVIRMIGSDSIALDFALGLGLGVGIAVVLEYCKKQLTLPRKYIVSQ